LIDLHEADFAQHKETFQPDPKLFNFITSPADLLLGAVCEAEARGLGKFKVEGGSTTVSASEDQLTLLAMADLYDSKGSYSITGTLHLVSWR